MNVLVLGSGGREHALAWKISKSPLLSKLYIAPGNGGTREVGENIAISPMDFDAVKRTILELDIQLVVVGPEDPLVAGIVDFIKGDALINKTLVIGPSAKAAQLEGSKDYAKAFMHRHQIPTANYKTFDAYSFDAACEFMKTLAPPYVLKADGLAAGKGVVILDSFDAACAELQRMFSGKFGEAGAKVVIEEFLSGIEFSMFVLLNDKDFVVLPSAKDYKRIGEGDTGLNTGGMGAVSPVPFLSDELLNKTVKEVVIPSVEGIQSEGLEYCGFLFIGLIVVDGKPKVIEYNVRMGDPETEVVIPRVESDLLELLLKTAQSKIEDYELMTTSQFATTVMAVSGGYPENYEKGKVITGMENVTESILFHAGTLFNDGEELVTSGGRVLAFTSLADSLHLALDKSYKSINKICFEGINYRKDIGKDLF